MNPEEVMRLVLSLTDSGSIDEAVKKLERLKGAADSAKAGYEVLEGNGKYAVQAPLSTLHLFQGWADQMLTTPANGVRDLMFTLTGVYDGYKLIGCYHDFDFQHVSGNIGREWDASLTRTFADHFTVELIVADYLADNRVAAGTTIDTLKVWTALTVSY